MIVRGVGVQRYECLLASVPAVVSSTRNHFVDTRISAHLHVYYYTYTTFTGFFIHYILFGEDFKFRIQYGLLVFTSLNTVSSDALLTP